MTGKIITSVLTGVGAYALIKYVYEKGYDKGRSDLWNYFENADQKDFDEMVEKVQRHREKKQK